MCEWNVQRNLKTPVLLNVNDVDEPWGIDAFFDHAPL